jgi:hypothetical protein
MADRGSGERRGFMGGGGADESDVARGEAGGGCDGRAGGVSPADPARVRLYSRQHVGQRHSTMSEPSAPLKRVSRHPNCALMSV